MKEMSPYEGKFDNLNGSMGLGRIVSVDNVSRRCRIKTIGKPGFNDDQDLPNVQWISLSNSGAGADDAALPTVNQYGVVCFINSEPYILGWFQPINSEGDAERPDKAPLQAGDRIIKTIGGNAITLLAGGTIQIQSTDMCRMFFIPSQNLINVVAFEMEIEMNGGYNYWDYNDTDDTTIYELGIYDNLAADYGLQVQAGTTDSGALFNVVMGEVDPTGNTTDVTEPAWQFSVQNNGDTTLVIGTANQVVVQITAETGDVQFTTQGNITQKVAGNVTQTIEGDVTQNITGDVDQTVKGSSTQTVTGDVNVSTEGNATVTAQGDAKVDAQGAATVSGDTVSIDGTAAGGSGATLKALGYPNALSDFTGLPIEAFSETVSISE